MPRTGSLVKIIVLMILGLIVMSASAFSFAQSVEGATPYKTNTESYHDDNIEKISFAFDGPLTAPLTISLSDHVDSVKDDYPYAGMAVYLGAANPLKIMANGKSRKIKPKGDKAVSSDGEWTGFKGRFVAAMVNSSNGQVDVTKDDLTISWRAGSIPNLTIISGLVDIAGPTPTGLPVDFRSLKYSHLPGWLAALCKALEWLLKSIHGLTGLSWGISLILFTLLVKILTIPLSNLTKKFQDKVNQDKAALEPIFSHIKQNYKGEEAHNRTMAAYKAQGITPYHVLKPLLATMISLPILIAIFNMLGEISVLRNASFLWVPSLAYPDQIAGLPFSFPLIGDTFNAMPFLMTGVTILSTYTMTSETASADQSRRDKRSLYLMAAFFLILFFPFPAGMVLFWTLYSAFQFAITKITKVDG